MTSNITATEQRKINAIYRRVNNEQLENAFSESWEFFIKEMRRYFRGSCIDYRLGVLAWLSPDSLSNLSYHSQLSALGSSPMMVVGQSLFMHIDLDLSSEELDLIKTLWERRY